MKPTIKQVISDFNRFDLPLQALEAIHRALLKAYLEGYKDGVKRTVEGNK